MYILWAKTIDGFSKNAACNALVPVIAITSDDFFRISSGETEGCINSTFGNARICL